MSSIGPSVMSRACPPTVRLVAAVFAFSMGVTGCDSLGGRTATVQFRTAEGIERGSTVWLAGLQIGATKDVKIVAGQAEVGVTLYRKYRDALPEHAVFVLSSDPEHSGERRLVVYDLAAIAPELRAADGKYPGFRNVFELAFAVGADKAQQIWDSLGKLPLPGQDKFSPSGVPTPADTGRTAPL